MDKSLKLTRIQKLIGQRMVKSKQEIPCFYLQARADVTRLAKFRKGPCRKAGLRAGTNDFFFKAMANSIEKFPLFAGSIQGDSIEINKDVNIGFAVDAPQGLVVPVVKNCQKLSISEISENVKILTANARKDKLSVDDLTGGCISLSSLGMFGLTSFIAIVPPKQASILAIGKIIDSPEVIEGSIENRKIMNLTLSVDHRIINGVYAAGFLEDIINQLERPETLVNF